MDSLRERFPEMKPMTGAPSLFTWNGCGSMIYGRRDDDPETGTYVKTLTLSLIFVPVFALKAYRVAAAPNGGWYFLGKVPLSGVAKAWNVFVVLAVAVAIGGGVWWSNYNSPEGKAGRRRAEADASAAAGRFAEAAAGYRELLQPNGPRSSDARTRLAALATDPAVPADQLVAVFTTLADAQRLPAPPL